MIEQPRFMDTAEREPHAIVELALYAVDPAGGAHHRKTVQKAMDNLHDEPDLRHAVVSLVSFAKRLDDAGHTESADWLLDVACSTRMALIHLGGESRRLAEDLGRMKNERFNRFAGNEVRRRAPKYGVAGASGSVLLRDLLPPEPKRS